MIFPELGPQYFDEKHKGILSMMEAFYAQSITINQSYWGEGDTDLRFYTGDQTLWSDLYGNLPANQRRQFNFNRIMRIVNMISGHQRRNRKSTVVIPIENGDEETSDQFTKIMMWINQQEGVLETISESFQGALITGMNLLHVWMDYREDPVSGNIKVDNCAYNAFLIDPYFRKPDLSDCNAIWKRSFLTKREVVSLLPDMEDEILGLMGNDSGSGRDGKFQFLPESYGYGMKNLLTYDEFYHRDYRKQRVLCDTETGEVMEWRFEGKEEELDRFLQTYPTVTVIEQDIPTVKLAIVVQGKVMYHDAQPSGLDVYPFIPVFAYYHPELPYFPWRITGVVRHLRDAQYLYNRRKIIELDILESQMNSGFIFKENALVNPLDVYMQQGQGRGIAIKDEANIADVVQIQSPAIPPTTIELSKSLGAEIQEIAGASDELMGFDNKDTMSGLHSMLKQSASLTTLQGLFDNLDRAQKLLGKVIIDLVQTNFTPGKVKKILEGQEPAPQFYNKAFGKYHAAVEEGLNTTTQKQMQLAQMLDLREIGVPITNEDLLEATTFQGKKKIVENMQKQQQAMQEQQQQQMQSQIEEQQARTQLAKARSVADEGLGLERVSRVQENQALAEERRAQARKDDESALLEKVKALKELDSIDFSHIKELIEMAHMLEAQTMAKQQAKEASAQAKQETKNTPQNGSAGGS
jgi:hypothetical protein